MNRKQMQFIMMSLGVMLHGIAFSDIITVIQDGTGDYSVIQDAINASSSGDTVLVYPGTYFENLNFNGKSITLASLNLTLNDPAYITQTVIDGNYSGSCIRIDSGEIIIIHGFKITHGSGIPSPSGSYSKGGGAYIYESQAQIINCIVTENHAGDAGGLYLINSPTFLSGTTISYNTSQSNAGGIGIATDSSDMNITFDTLHRCNIYLNFAGTGSDIYKNYSSDTLYLALDTFTVMNPDNYHIYESDYSGFPIQNMVMDIRHSKIEAIASDLYVSPQGSNDNSGISTEDPLKNLSFALAKIISDPDTIRTIHLANGVYSPSTNQESFPVNIRSYVNIQGESRDSTILDADSLTYLLYSMRLDHDYVISNLTLQRGNGDDFADPTGGIRMISSYNATLKNLLITRCYHDFASACNTGSSDNVRFINVEVAYCKRGSSALRIGSGNVAQLGLEPDSVYLTNCMVHHCGPGQDPESSWGGGINIFGQMSHPAPSFNVFLMSCLVSENLAQLPSQYYVCPGVLIDSHVLAYLTNCTLGNNIGQLNPDNCAIAVQRYSMAYITNSILYGNKPRQAGVFGYENEPSELHIGYSLVQGGEDSIFTTYTTKPIYYDFTNINTDPLWDTASLYPYSLSAGSPCIDAGTLNLPPGIELPEYDIAGNPRVWGESVDMGAYEYGPWVRVPTVPNSKFQIPNSKLLDVSPNPFEVGTYIRYELHEKGRLNISVYSLAGRKVKTLIHSSGLPGEAGKFYWDGRDEQGHELPAGTYVIRMTVEDQLLEAVKGVKSR